MTLTPLLAIPGSAAAAEANRAPQGAGPTGTSAAKETQPPAGLPMHAGYAQVIARMAYVWGWPMVNMLNRFAAATDHVAISGAFCTFCPKSVFSRQRDGQMLGRQCDLFPVYDLTRPLGPTGIVSPWHWF